MSLDKKIKKEFSLEQCRKKFPEWNHLSDNEVIEARDKLCELAKFAIEVWIERKRFQNPTWLLTSNDDAQE